MSTKPVRIYHQQIRGLAGRGRSWYDTVALNLKRVPYTPIRLSVDKLVVKSHCTLHGSFSFIKAHISFNYKAGFWFLLGLLIGTLFLGHASGQTPAVSDPIVSVANKPLKPLKPLKTPNLQPQSRVALEAIPAAVSATPVSGCTTDYFTGNSYIDYIISHESGGNTCALNGGGCFGLMQACPGAPLRAACGGNGACQIDWFATNKMASYGSWGAVYLHELAYGWW